jgi:hypothetical protein
MKESDKIDDDDDDDILIYDGLDLEFFIMSR